MNLFKTLPVLSASERESAKDHLFAAVHFWCELNAKGRKEGILALEYPLLDNDEHKIRLPDGTNPFPPVPAADEGYADSEDWLFARLLQLVCDGTDSDILRTIAHYSLCNLEKHVPLATHLSLLVGAQAICNIQAGEPLQYTRFQLSAMLGSQLCEEFLSAEFPPLALTRPYAAREEHTAEYEPTDEERKKDDEVWAASESDAGGGEDWDFAFDDLVMLDDRSLQKVLHVVLERMDVSRALQGVDGEVQAKLFRNMSARASDDIKARLAQTASEADAQEARKKIISVVRYLEKTGNIVIAFAPAASESDGNGAA